MARRPTIPDIASEAGVSIATVNRVLAGAATVREETGRRVAQAAQRIGYHATNLIEQRLMSTAPPLRLGLLLQREGQDFGLPLAEAVRTAARAREGTPCEVLVEIASSAAPAETAAQLIRFRGRVDVVAAMAVNHPAITGAVVTLRAAGIETFALLSDFAQGERAAYLGLNNLKTGRGAARMLAVAARRRGKIAIFVGGHRWHGHDLREAGFRGYFREHVPPFQVLDTLVNLETRALTYEATLDLLERHEDVVGIYVAGGGTEGAIAALREIRGAGEVALVVGEMTAAARLAMTEGHVTMIVAPPLEALAARLVALAAEAVAGGQAPGQVFLAPDLHLPEFDL